MKERTVLDKVIEDLLAHTGSEQTNPCWQPASTTCARALPKFGYCLPCQLHADAQALANKLRLVEKGSHLVGGKR